jgi:hypothetical protein
MIIEVSKESSQFIDADNQIRLATNLFEKPLKVTFSSIRNIQGKIINENQNQLWIQNE